MLCNNVDGPRDCHTEPETLTWLAQLQGSAGCWKPLGYVFLKTNQSCCCCFNFKNSI